MTGRMISCRLNEKIRRSVVSIMKEIRGHGFGYGFFFIWKGIKMDSVNGSVRNG